MPANALRKIRVLIVDDIEPVRQGLHTILRLSDDLEVVGEACDGLEAIRAAESLKPDVVLMDLEMPALGGLEATRRIKERQPKIGVVILTIHGDDEMRHQATRVGADAFIEKEASTEDLLVAIRHISTADDPNCEGNNNDR